MKSPEKDKPATRRKPYATPVVQAYGSVRSITRAGGTMSANMDGLGVKAKTS